MAIIETSNLHTYRDKTPQYQGTFQTQGNNQKSKIAAYLDSLYSYPPKIKVKWNTLDEFNNDSAKFEKTKNKKQDFPLTDFVENWFFNGASQELINENYTVDQYIEGYLDKVNSTNFYNKSTKDLQQSLKKVPVFAILNGNGEIILNKSAKEFNSKNFQTIINEKVYDTAGSFDSTVEKQQQLGLFFMNKFDAETYLKAVAQSDIDGTQTVGLSINCIGLDAAYRITREYHPGIDFRFVPDLNEVQNLLSNQLSDSKLIVEEDQQQLKYQLQVANLFPFLEKIGLRVSQSIGAHSFLQSNEYFKGVPIYVVQTTKNPRNILAEQYFNIVGTIDTSWAKLNQSITRVIGLGDNHVLQGRLADNTNKENIVNYVFFEKKQADSFVKKQGRNVARYKGAKVSKLEFIIKKPKIFVYNLEDFIEAWEDNISAALINNTEVQTIYQADSTIFVSPTKNLKEIVEFKKTYKDTPFKNIIQGLGLKVRVLKRNIGVFTSVD